MSGLGEAFAALKNIALLHERVGNLRGDVEALNANVSGLREYAVTIDTRVARLEGFIEGAAMASRGSPQLPKD
jgi:hypothetical protein